MKLYQTLLSLDYHQLGLVLFIIASTLSLLLIVLRGLSHELKALLSDWIQMGKELRHQWRTPLSIEKPSQPAQLLEKTDSKRELSSGD